MTTCNVNNILLGEQDKLFELTYNLVENKKGSQEREYYRCESVIQDLKYYFLTKTGNTQNISCIIIDFLFSDLQLKRISIYYK